MGRPKQLLPWGGTTLVDWQVGQMLAAGAEEVVLVLGHQAEAIKQAVKHPARVVVNDDYKQGRASSLRAGAKAVDMANAVLILSVDQPRPAWVSQRLLERWHLGTPAIVSPRFPSRFGHPVLLDGGLLAELRAVSEETLGLRAVIDAHVKEAVSVEVKNQAVDVDLNTPAEYESAFASFAAGEWDEAIEE